MFETVMRRVFLVLVAGLFLSVLATMGVAAVICVQAWIPAVSMAFERSAGRGVLFLVMTLPLGLGAVLLGFGIPLACLLELWDW